jgi:hypothetical protein
MPAKATTSQSSGFAYGALLLGWLVPGAGHFLSGRWVRGLILFAAITGMFAIGLAANGRLYAPSNHDIIALLAFIGELGAGALFLVSKALGFGNTVVTVVSADYGTMFAIIAGLLNIIAAVDAHNLHIGRKS